MSPIDKFVRVAEGVIAVETLVFIALFLSGSLH